MKRLIGIVVACVTFSAYAPGIEVVTARLAEANVSRAVPARATTPIVSAPGAASSGGLEQADRLGARFLTVPAPSGSLAWSPPRLDNPTTVQLSAQPNTVWLDAGKDYRIVLPQSPVTKAVAIRGGRNVVLIGGEIAIPWQGSNPTISSRRALLLRDQTGTVHVEGLLIRGDDVSEGIQISAPRATVQLQNIRVENLHARDQQNFSDNHPDVVQPYGGVADLRIDKLTGYSDYQGLFLAEDLGPIGRVELRRVNIVGASTARYLLWRGEYPTVISDVWAQPGTDRSWDRTVWPSPDHWSGARSGQPASGDFVKPGDVGIGYQSVNPGS